MGEMLKYIQPSKRQQGRVGAICEGESMFVVWLKVDYDGGMRMQCAIL